MKVKAKELKQGDLFVFDNREQVAIDSFNNNCLWVTKEEYYLTSDKRKEFTYGYTNATILSIESDSEVELVKNIEK